MPTIAATSVSSDDQHDLSLSGLRMSKIALELVAAGHSLTPSTTDSVDAQSAASEATAESELSQLPREPDLSTSTEPKRRKMDDADTERQSVATEAAKTEPGPADSQPVSTTSQVRSRPVGIIYQSSLPELGDSSEDRDSAPAVVSVLLFSTFRVVIVVHDGRVVAAHVCLV